MKVLSDEFDSSLNKRTIHLNFYFHHGEGFTVRVPKSQNLIAWSATKELPHVKEDFYFLRHVSGNGIREFNFTLTFRGNERREFYTTTAYFGKSRLVGEVMGKCEEWTQPSGVVSVFSEWNL